MNKQEAATFLDVSVRTLERHISRGAISVSYVQGANGRERTFDRDELARFKETLLATTYVARPVTSGTSDTTALAPIEKSRALAVVESTQKPEREIVPIPAKLMLTREEAARFAGLPLTMIRQAIEDRRLKAIRTGAGWRVKRADVEAYVRKL